MIQKIGGMDVQILKPLTVNTPKGEVIIQELGTRPYHYQILHFGKNSEFHLDLGIRCCIYIFQTDEICPEINGYECNNNEVVLGNTKNLQIKCSSRSTILLAYHEKKEADESFTHFHEKEAKKVEKPWGYEIWLTGDPSELFAFKRIYIKAGNKTSLQYHQFKRETNFIVEGTANLYYDRQGVYRNGDDYVISAQSFQGPFVVDVFPNTIHRLEALTDMMLLEVSTPELDDVIRLQDDAGRSHGRISDEH